MGLFYWYTGEIYYGSWEEDQMSGEGLLYFAFGGYIYGTFIEDKVHGYGMLYFPNQDYILGNWISGRLDGEIIRYYAAKNTWIICEYSRGEYLSKISESKRRMPELSQDLQKLYEKQLSLFQSKMTGYESKNKKPDVCYVLFDINSWFHGLLSNNFPNGLGILYYNEVKNDRGIFKDGYIEGPGRTIFNHGDIFDGFYRKGKFNGLGNSLCLSKF